MLAPGRLELFDKLSRSHELPEPEQLYIALGELQALVKDTALTGTTTVPVVQADGSEISQPVTFAGPFAANSNGNFLSYQPERDRLLTAPRQPSLFTRLHAASFRKSDKDAMALDPNHGAILAAMASQPSLLVRIHSGGPITWLILTILTAGLILTAWRLIVLNQTKLKIEQQQRHPTMLSDNNALGRILIAWQKASRKGVSPYQETIRLRLDEAVMEETPRLETGHSLIKSLAIVTPLLGLLGTTIGVMNVFQPLTPEYGWEQLLTLEIAQTLMSTTVGLLAATLLTVSYILLNSRRKYLTLYLEMTATGLMADWQEKQNNSQDVTLKSDNKTLQEALP